MSDTFHLNETNNDQQFVYNIDLYHSIYPTCEANTLDNSANFSPLLVGMATISIEVIMIGSVYMIGNLDFNVVTLVLNNFI
jgi:hypothetical protein